MGRTPKTRWGFLFNFAGSGIVHMEFFKMFEIQHAQVVLTDADIRALVATPFALTGLATEDARRHLLLAHLTTNFSAAPYDPQNNGAYLVITAGQADNKQEISSPLINQQDVSISRLDDFLAQPRQLTSLTPNQTIEQSWYGTWTPVNGVEEATDPDTYANGGIWLSLSDAEAEITGGDSANTMTVDVLYYDLPAL